VFPEQHIETVFQLFSQRPQLMAIPVVKNGVPIGLINRNFLVDRYARPFRRELFGRKPCTLFMDSSPLIVDKNMRLEDLSERVVEAESRYLTSGFIITDNGLYLGMGTGHALIREMTQLQVRAARYANPLTLLPGNVPINEHIDKLLDAGVSFMVCYCDLNHFKPFNDVYGYSRGDDIIQLTAQVLTEVVQDDKDFVGHIGGDDFVVLFRSDDWNDRCKRILENFDQQIVAFFHKEDLDRGGYYAEDRRGQQVFHPLVSLALGILTVEPHHYRSHRDVSTAASEAKKMAKRSVGSALFVEPRRPLPLPPEPYQPLSQGTTQ
jgi:diguanylate cyclase (GGDEF)-like protein